VTEAEGAPSTLSVSGALGGTSAVLLIAGVWLNHDPRGLAFLYACPWKLTLGFPCLTCGITRVFLLLAEGEVMAAITLAPLPFLLVIGSLAAGAWWVLARVRGGRDPDVVITRFITRWFASRFVQVLAVVSVFAMWGYAIARSAQTGVP